MRTVDDLPPAVVQRAAVIARGPHACPCCEAPTWAEPPVPWTELRDYVVRCDACERPVAVRVDRATVERGGQGWRRGGGEVLGIVDPVTDLLDRRGAIAFAQRVAAALLAPLLLAGVVLVPGGGAPTALLLATLAIVPGALWGPAVVAIAWAAARDAAARVHRRPRRVAPIVVEPARWDQWAREERRRDRERAEQPEAVLRELERVLDDRELRRVRSLAERGEVPAEHLEDLLRFRRSWRTVA